jgi:hypothetical protein
MISMTGTTSGLQPDWPAIASAAGGDPHLVLSGPAFRAISSPPWRGPIDGQLSAPLRHHRGVRHTDHEPPAPHQNIVGDYIQQRANSFAQT